MSQIDSELIKTLINEGLLEFFIVSQISSDNLLTKENIEIRINNIELIKESLVSLNIGDKGNYLDMLSMSLNILLNELAELEKK